MKAAIYARVSTIGKGQDVDLQLRDLRNYAQARGWEIFKEYIDNGVSGRKDKRPALDQLVNDARKERFDVVLVWRFDRFARSTKHLVTSLDEFNRLGIDFISFMENIDTSSPMGKAMFTITSAIAELEVDLIRERVISGLANAKAKGARLGRPKAELDISELISLREKGLTVRALAKELDVSVGLVHKTLKNCCPKTLDNSRVGFTEMAVQ
jgi:DNA invertase Pin-like site-specific DNA recombinase